MEANQMLEFIVKANNLDRHDLRQVYNKSFAKKLSKQIGIHVDEYHMQTFVNNFKFNPDFPIEAEVERFKNKLTTKGLGLTQVQLFYKVGNIVSKLYLHRSKESRDKFKVSMGKYDMNTFITFLVWLLEDKILESSEQYEAYVKEHPELERMPFKLLIGDVKIQYFMNDRLDMKGLTQEQQDKIDWLLTTHEKINRW